MIKDSNVEILNKHLLKRESEEIHPQRNNNEKINYKDSQNLNNIYNSDRNENINNYQSANKINLNIEKEVNPNNFFSNPNSYLSNSYINISDLSSQNIAANNQSKKTYKLIHQNNKIQNTLKNSKNSSNNLVIQNNNFNNNNNFAYNNISINTNFTATNRNNSKNISKRNGSNGSVGNIKARSQQIWNSQAEHNDAPNSILNFNSNKSNNINGTVFSENKHWPHDLNAFSNQDDKNENNQNEVQENSRKERTSVLSNKIPSSNHNSNNNFVLNPNSSNKILYFNF
jgi:hypothetical protein